MADPVDTDRPAGGPEAPVAQWTAPDAPAASSAPHGARRGASVVAGIVSLIGGVCIAAGAFLPITTGDQGFSILQTGSGAGPDNYFAIEPIITGVLVALLGIIVLGRAISPALGGGLLVGLGMAETLAYAAYLGFAFAGAGDLAAGTAPPVGSGAFIGLAGALMATIGGGVTLSSMWPA
jgi:hypothetical protein